jgi:hypothetical protein
MTTQVCKHNPITFKNADDIGQIIRLQVADANKIDEAVVRFIDGASIDFDGNLDAHKMFSFEEDYPQLYSTANNSMAINSLPTDYREAISMDVVGVDGHSMTISVSEALDFEELYLKDEFTGELTNLLLEDYTFSYNAEVSDRFTLLFTISDVNELSKDEIRIFAHNKTIQVNLGLDDNANIAVYTLLGQEVVSINSNGLTQIPVYNTGYYVVKVSSDNGVSTKKVFIK